MDSGRIGGDRGEPGVLCAMDCAEVFPTFASEPWLRGPGNHQIFRFEPWYYRGRDHHCNWVGELSGHDLFEIDSVYAFVSWNHLRASVGQFD